ncbi:unnamed protein product [[Candida] boidinii]|nr:unnamed protein product [[Candida] boidinii]
MDFTQSSPRKNLASQYLKSIGSPILSGSPPPLAPTSRHNAGLSNLNDADSIAFRNSGGLDPDSSSRMTNLENENPFKSPKRLSQSPGHLTSPTRLQKSPSFKSFSTLSPVQKLIQQKEKDAINNNAEDIPPLQLKTDTLTQMIPYWETSMEAPNQRIIYLKAKLKE